LNWLGGLCAFKALENIFFKGTVARDFTALFFFIKSSVVEPDPELLAGAGAGAGMSEVSAPVPAPAPGQLK
jgi:hypothetical protein